MLPLGVPYYNNEKKLCNKITAERKKITQDLNDLSSQRDARARGRHTKKFVLLHDNKIQNNAAKTHNKKEEINWRILAKSNSCAKDTFSESVGVCACEFVSIV